MTDPALSAYAVLFADAVVCIVVPNGSNWRLIGRLVLYAALSGILFNFNLSPFLPMPGDLAPDGRIAGQLVKVVWWLSGARLLSQALDRLLLPRAWRKQRLFQEVFGALIFLGAIVAALGFVFALPIRGLVATSGALAIILGLAIQSTLSDVFTGIVLNTTEPYHVGDWVSIDDAEGTVIEMNWRATHLLNSQRNVVVVPNSVAAKAKITNINRPSNMHGILISYYISPEHSPKIVLDALNMALIGCRSLLVDPAPFAHIKSTDLNAIRYEIVCYVADLDVKRAVESELFELCFRHLTAFHISLLTSSPLNVRPAGESSGDPGTSSVDLVMLLRNVVMFRTIPHAELNALAARMTRSDFDVGEHVVEPDTVTDSLTIVFSGVLSVSRDEDGTTRELARFGPGDTFGEAGLLTGSSFGLSVTALTPASTFQIARSDISPILKQNPDAAKQLCAQLSRRQDALGKLTQPAPISENAAQSAFHWLMEKVQQLHFPSDASKD